MKEQETNKLACDHMGCRWRGFVHDALVASHPFIHGEFVQGCPKCKNIETLRLCCHEPGCWDRQTMGTPLNDGGYIMTCWKHRPKEEWDKEPTKP